MKSSLKSERDKSFTKVRIFVSDPYATDDSSTHDEVEVPKPRNVKRIVHEVYLPYQPSENSQVRGNGVKTFRKNYPRQSKKPVRVRLRQSKKPVEVRLRQFKYPVGVRLRKSGKFSAEITNPITKAKKWLGTYETCEEAAKAYVDKMAEYKTLLSVNRQSLCSPASPSVHCVNADGLSKDDMSLKNDDVASGDFTKEMSFNFNFSNLQIPDLSFLAAEKDYMISGANGDDLDFDSFLMDDDSNHLLGDFSLLNKDININGFESGTANELPDCDFTDMEFELGDLKVPLWDQPTPVLNIACP